MMDRELIASVRSEDVQSVRSLLAEGANTEASDEHGWTALCWAAGKGDVAAIELLLESGANPFAMGKDRRTPYQIAVAASRINAARRLAEAETASGREDAIARSSAQAARRPYCRAYTLGELRQFSGWAQKRAERDADDTVVFLHRDLSVTRTIWPHEAVLFDGASAEWEHFCTKRLAFQPPDDFEWCLASSEPRAVRSGS